MSLGLEQLDRKTLDRFDLPKTVDSLQGLDRLFLQKVLNLAYTVNDIWTIPHKVDERVAAAIGTAAEFTAPINARRLIFEARVQFDATATVGTRSIAADLEVKKTNPLQRYAVTSRTANQLYEWAFTRASTTNADATFQITYPMVLEPEWALSFDDEAAIDTANDTIAWRIEYAEIPI